MSGQDPGGLNLSTREIASLLKRARDGTLSQDDINEIYDRVPRKAKVDFIQYFLEEKIIPHLNDIQDRAESMDAQRFRETYAEQDYDTKDELLMDAVQDVVATLFELREHPEQGLLNLKEIIRNPATVEALLLVFDDENIPPDYSAQAKDFASWYITAAGVALAPELYDENTVRDVYDAFNLSIEHENR